METYVNYLIRLVSFDHFSRRATSFLLDNWKPMNKNPDDSNNKGIYGEIEIYHNQYNIGQEIVNSFVKLGAISDKIEDLRKYDSIHVHVLGPVFTTLGGSN